MTKPSAESHHILIEVYGEYSLTERTYQKWFPGFNRDDFWLEDKKRPG